MSSANNIRYEIIKDYESFVRYMTDDGQEEGYDDGRSFRILPNHEFILNRIDLAIQQSIEVKASVESYIMPPRHGKTHLCSRLFLPYIFGRFPKRRCMYITSTSGSDSSGAGASTVKRDIEQIMNTDKYRFAFPEAYTLNNIPAGKIPKSIRKLVKNTDTLIINPNHPEGFLYFTGIDGQINGLPADVIIVDDVYKNQEESLSQKTSDRIWRTYQTVIERRREPGSITLVTFTRWSNKDILGRLERIARDNTDPNYIPLSMFRFSAERTAEDLWYDKRKQGEPLDIRMLSEYASAKKDESVWMALYQGMPIDEQYQLFKISYFPRYYKRENWQRIFIVVDANFKENSKQADRTGILVFGTFNNALYVIDVVNQKMDYPELLRTVLYLCFEKYPKYWVLIVENAANGIPMIQQFRERRIPRVHAMEPFGKKLWRAQDCLPFIRGGSMFLPSSDLLPAVYQLIDELINFTGLANDERDDLVDCLCYGIKYFELYGRFDGVSTMQTIPHPTNRALPIPRVYGRLQKPKLLLSSPKSRYR